MAQKTYAPATVVVHGNPTTSQLEQKIALLEGGEDCTAFSSGMGAISATLLSLAQLRRSSFGRQNALRLYIRAHPRDTAALRHPRRQHRHDGYDAGESSHSPGHKGRLL